jgi:hypothetical protein
MYLTLNLIIYNTYILTENTTHLKIYQCYQILIHATWVSPNHYGQSSAPFQQKALLRQLNSTMVSAECHCAL